MWYLQKKGKSEGPISEEALIRAIQKKQVGPFDLLYKEGDSLWRMASEFELFKGAFEASSLKTVTDQWVLLSKNKKNQSFKQSGPYTTEQIKSMLISGQAHWSDYVWREGMKEWYRITALGVFFAEGDNSSNSIVGPNKSEIMSHVEILKRQKENDHPQLPPEASGPDLTQVQHTKAPPEPRYEAELPRTSEIVQKQKKNKKDVVISRRLSIWNRIEEMTPNQKWWVRSLFLFVLVAGSVLTLVWTSYRDFKNLKKYEVVAAPAAESIESITAPEQIPVPAPVEVKPVIAKKEPQPQPVFKRPQYLRLKVANNGSSEAQVIVETDAQGYAVEVYFESNLGQSIGSKSYFRRVQFSSSNYKVIPKELKVPAGEYNIKAQFVDKEFLSMAEVTRLSYDTQGRQYKAELAAHKKSISHWSSIERIQLIQLSTRADDLVSEYIKAFNSFSSLAPNRKAYSSWRKKFELVNSQAIRKINFRNRNEYVYASQWLQLKELRLQVIEKTAQISRSKTEQDFNLKLSELKKAANDIERFKEGVINSSLWK